MVEENNPGANESGYNAVKQSTSVLNRPTRQIEDNREDGQGEHSVFFSYSSYKAFIRNRNKVRIKRKRSREKKRREKKGVKGRNSA